MLSRISMRGKPNSPLYLLVWKLLVALSVAQAAANSLLGRTAPLQATLGWALAALVVSAAVLAWSLSVSERAYSVLLRRSGRGFSTLALTQLPLLIVSVAISLALYLSDEWYHHSATLLHPAPAVLLLLSILVTAVGQEALIWAWAEGKRLNLLPTLIACRRWALPASLLLLGFLQGSSFLWVIGNDFTRYWAVSDAIASAAGYPASRHQAVYVAAGMYPLSIELPFFPILLLLSFTVFGHNTLAAHIPGLLANSALPLLLYGFYHRAGLGRPLAFALSCSVALLPYFRLYTLNAPVPDPVFEALLVATAYLFLRLAANRRGESPSSREGECRTRTGWLLFGLLGGLTALTRPEGVLFVPVMFLGLLPNLLRRRFYLSVGTFLATVAPFSVMMMLTFGIPWPRNQGGSASLENIVGNLQWLERYSLRWYAEPLGLPPSAFVLLAGLLTLLAALGTLWMATRWWQAALLPVATALHVTFVFTIDPRASGADQWFDFFRHISYGLPFVLLSIAFLAKELLEGIHRIPFLANRWRPTGLRPACILALLLLLLSAYELRLLAFPSATYGGLGRQLLTSDVWVSLPNVVSNRYDLPHLSFVNRDGTLMIDPESRYIPRHLTSVANHFKPVSSLATGRGTGYQLSSMLIILFGAVFSFVGAARIPDERQRT